MDHIAEVSRPKKLMAAPREHTGCQAGEVLRETLSALPWLLAVAGQFRAGDVMTLEDGISWLEGLLEVKEIRPGAEDQAKEIHKVIRCLRRMLAAARCMEAEL